jgi:large subunit ribosomal protein L19
MHQTVIAFNKTLREKKLHTLPELRSGDVIRVYRKIVEGEKTRTQMFQGMVLAIRGGQSSSPTITVRKVVGGIGVELVLPLLSSQVEKIEILKATRSRRAKLFYVRTKSTKVIGKKLREVSARGRDVLETKVDMAEVLDDTVVAEVAA